MINGDMGGFQKVMGDPQVTIGFSTKSWAFMTWMIWRCPHGLETSI